MIIGPNKLLELVNEINLVEDLAERELNNPEGAGFDLRVGEIHVIDGGVAFLGEFERETPQMKTIATYKKGSKQEFTIAPGDFYLVTTIETLNLPPTITSTMKPRSTTFRSGLNIRTGNIQPGYKGKLTFSVKNDGPIPVTIELGCRIVHVQFFWIQEGGSKYRGQWQGGRITTEQREKQI